MKDFGKRGNCNGAIIILEGINIENVNFGMCFKYLIYIHCVG